MINNEEKDIRSLGERMARIETKMDIIITKTELVDQVKEIAVRAEAKADANAKELAEWKKVKTTFTTFVLLAVLGAVLSLVLINQ